MSSIVDGCKEHFKTQADMQYGVLPHGTTVPVSRFKASMSPEALEELHLLVRSAKIAPVTYENDLGDEKFGISRSFLVQAKAAWAEYDWRKSEEYINKYPNFKASLAYENHDYDVHFVGLFSKNQNARPLLLLHGWPGSFLEFLPIADLFKRQYSEENLPYHIIIPSLPGYAFSSGPAVTTDFSLDDVSKIIHSLMDGLKLGTSYLIHAGDVGSQVALRLANSSSAVKVTNGISSKPDDADETYTQQEVEGLQRVAEFSRSGTGYAIEQSTKPATIGLVLATNPLALLAWIGEKYQDWTDTTPPLITILETATLYWLTDTLPRSLYPYRDLFSGSNNSFGTQGGNKTTPFGISWFPKEPAPFPQSWFVGQLHVTFFRHHDKGGHFAGLEQPEVLKKDLEDFFSQIQ
ncbi:uncharacterized protein PV06_05439 [Exophiala oligosperma]|uniref:Epoxide hydrolase N-terminal domain-containing protein n=1 Tax=Exophiala oligosperma TaxID=215243 RepID=A0A0D2BWH5_9EURO|nr:uncharacterized protein PV06_05439 [Exophiala oligosperma]KIW41832.1 hypothetical protein PV06_05439 [Exophiala oligosperma]